MKCEICKKSPADNLDLILLRINPHGIKGIFRCQFHKEGWDQTILLLNRINSLINFIGRETEELLKYKNL